MTSSQFNDLPEWSTVELQRLISRGVFDGDPLRRRRTGLGGSHTVVTYPPLDVLEPLEPSSVLSKVTASAGLHLYAHIPFCEFLCGFCHYDTTFAKLGGPETDLMAAYCRALGNEVSSWASLLKGSTLATLYLGGGTPTALSEDRLRSILEVLDAFPRAPNFSACVETSPLTIRAPGGPQKLAALVKAGITRVSIGLQTFNSELLRHARGHSQERALSALEVVMSHVDNVNVDLIQDLPDQTDEHIVEDLACIERFRPAQVTWYILRVQQDADWFRRYERGALLFPRHDDSIRRSLMIREGLRRLGYIARPGNRYVREARFADQFKDVRSGLSETLLGVGVSAYSHGWGYLFRNVCSSWRERTDGIRQYIDRIANGGFAISSGYVTDGLEQTASALVAGLRRAVAVPPSTPETASYLAEASETLGNLQVRGLVAIDSQGQYSLTECGRLFEEEICALFFSVPVTRRLASRGLLAEPRIETALRMRINTPSEPRLDRGEFHNG